MPNADLRCVLQNYLDRMAYGGMRWAGDLSQDGGVLHGWWPTDIAGPTVTEVLSNAARASLRSVVRQAVLREPRNRCKVRVKDVQARTSAGINEDGFGGITLKRFGKDIFIRAMRKWGNRYAPRKLCDMWNCFNATRPACRAEGPLRVYWYGLDDSSKTPGSVFCKVGQCEVLFDAEGLGSNQIRVVQSPQEACILVFTMYWAGGLEVENWLGHKSFKFAVHLKHWHAVDGIGGRNHMLIMPQCMQDCGEIGETVAWGSGGEAMVVSQSLWRGTMRPGFDVMVPHLYTGAMEKFAAAALATIHQRQVLGTRIPRPLLVGFRGTYLAGGVWFTSRAIGSEWAHDPVNGVIVDVKFEFNYPVESCRTYEAESYSFEDLLFNCSFGFAPGGGGPYSFRFSEALFAGAVPVVTDDLVLPMEDAGISRKRWDECVVRVTLEELFALREVLMAVAAPGSAAFVRRQIACEQIWHKLFADGLKSSPGSKVAHAASVHRLFWESIRQRIVISRKAHEHN